MSARGTTSASRSGSKRPRRASSAQSQLARARAKVDDLESGLADLRAELDDEIDDIRNEWDDKAARITTLEVPLDKSDIKVGDLGLVWIPMGT